VQFSVKVSRTGMWPTVWEASVYKDGFFETKFDSIWLARAVHKARKFVREYAEFNIDIRRV
jgi:hypothetical protein